MDSAAVVEFLRVALSAIYYPLWAACSLIYSLYPLSKDAKFDKYFDSVTVKDDKFTFYEQLNGEKKIDTSSSEWEQIKQIREKIVESVLKIVGLDTSFIKEIINGKQNTIFSKDKFCGYDDPLVCYRKFSEFIESFYALSFILNGKIDEILSMEQYETLIVIKFKIRWMTPFEQFNKQIFSGVTLNDVMIIKLDDSNKSITNIYEFWNGKKYFNFCGFINNSRRITSLLSLPFVYAVSYIANNYNYK